MPQTGLDHVTIDYRVEASGLSRRCDDAEPYVHARGFGAV